ncbi:MAG: sodium/glutamate symporter, partial [[Clostridium] symbiosum]
MEIKLDMTQTVCLGVLVFLAGQFVVSKVHFLEKYCIPAPAIGGLLFSIINMAGVQTGAFQFAFDQTLKDFFMIAFFSTIGFSASLKIIKKGGIAIFILFCTSSVMLIIQNVWGVAIARAFGLNPLLGMCAGSISLMGGVGSSAAFAPIMEQNGAVGGLTFAIASATFGLVMGGLVSGPIAKFLIDRHKLKDVRKTGVKEVDYGSIEVDEEASVIEVSSMHKAFFQIIIAMGAGTVISKLISLSGMVFPAYVGAIFAAAFIRNGGEAAHIKVYT